MRCAGTGAHENLKFSIPKPSHAAEHRQADSGHKMIASQVCDCLFAPEQNGNNRVSTTYIPVKNPDTEATPKQA